MGENETISWIKSQLDAGYDRSAVRDMLIQANYAPETADRLLSMALDTKAGIADKISGSLSQNNGNAQKTAEFRNPINNEISWIKVGAYAGIGTSSIFVAIFLALVFLDMILSINTVISYAAVILFGSSVVAGRTFSGSMKKTLLSAFVSSVILGVTYAAFVTLFGGYIINFDAIGESNESVVVQFYTMVFIGSIAGIVILMTILSIVLRFVLKRVQVPKINVLKPLTILSIMYIVGVGLFCLTGSKITHEPFEVYWCDGNAGEACVMEKTYEEMFSKVTGYNFKTYFSNAPNANNRFAMNKYELATALFTMANLGSVSASSLSAASIFAQMNMTDEYYDNVIRKSEFNRGKELGSLGDRINLKVDGENSYLSNLKKMIENTDIVYRSNDAFTDKQQHLKYIQAKMDIGNALKKSISSMDAFKGLEFGNGFYGTTMELAVSQIFQLYDDFVEMQTTKIKIVFVSFRGAPAVGRIETLEIKVKNDGIYPMEYLSHEKPQIYVGRTPANEVKCDFTGLDVGEEGICTASVEYDDSYPKIIRLIWPVGYGSEYTLNKIN